MQFLNLWIKRAATRHLKRLWVISYDYQKLVEGALIDILWSGQSSAREADAIFRKSNFDQTWDKLFRILSADTKLMGKISMCITYAA